ncbi:hypothetical protein [Bifidobacterium thermacidophilum]|uniref:hypothetical protein n=1 Tax=Bifidobacterium thermacidophilum TaxID=246618 RepID=UPI003EFD8761
MVSSTIRHRLPGFAFFHALRYRVCNCRIVFENDEAFRPPPRGDEARDDDPVDDAPREDEARNDVPRADLARPADCVLEPTRRPKPPVLRPQSRPADDFTACPDFGLLEDVEAPVFVSVFVVLPNVVDAPGFIVSAAVDSIAFVVSAGSAIISMSSDDAGRDA